MGLVSNIRVVLLLSILLLSCKKKTGTNNNANISNNTGTYFSVKQFAQDQWETFKGQPFTFEKKIVSNGHTDTGLVIAQDMNWGEIVRPFFEADISDTSFLGKYTFSVFDESSSSTQNLYYKANDPDLFTQVLQITIDPFNNKIKAIYIETHKQTFWKNKSQKLYYAPLKSVLIQDFEEPRIGSSKTKIVSYHFMT